MLILKSLVAALVSVPGGCGTKGANNLLKDNFVTYREDLGTDFSDSAFSSLTVFNSVSFLLHDIFNQPPSTINNKE